MRTQRIGVMAEMHGRDLLRRRVALALLVMLPLSFYLASSDGGQGAVTPCEYSRGRGTTAPRRT